MNEFLVRHSGKIIVVAAALTILLVMPLLFMGGRGLASYDPSGEIFELQTDINQRFAPTVHWASYIIESKTGDILTQASLWELYQNERILREDDAAGKLAPDKLTAQAYLYESFDVDTGASFVGVYTLADAVQMVLSNQPDLGVTLETATDEQIKLALHLLFTDPSTDRFKQALTATAYSERREAAGREIDYWVSSAFAFDVFADNPKLGGGTFQIGVSGDQVALDKEEFSRNVQEVLRGEQETFNLWGVAIDLNSEAADEGQTAGLFIMATVVAVVIIAGLSLKSYWAVALIGTGLGALMIWLKGISNLVGIKEGLVIDFIVPIALISLGVDFALHALWRYKQEKDKGLSPNLALRIGFAGVLGALVLAMVSDSIAFLANVSSRIEAVFHFGLAAGIAVVSSFVVLGIVVPLVMMRLDQLRSSAKPEVSWRARITFIGSSLGVASATGAGVIFLIALSEAIGVAIILANIGVFLVVPWLVVRMRKQKPIQENIPISTPDSGDLLGFTGRVVAFTTRVARFRVMALLAVAGLTAAAAIFAIRLDATFDPRDFYDSSSDFVVGLDKVDEHFGEEGGEPGIIYLEGDLSNVDALRAIDEFIAALGANPDVAKWDDGSTQIDPRTVTGLFRQVIASEYALRQVHLASGIEITDTDGDGLPDDSNQARTIMTYVLLNGIPLDENKVVYTQEQVREVLHQGLSDDGNDEAIFTVAISNTREQQNVVAARKSLSQNLELLDGNPAITRVGLTGSPFTRVAQLEASTDTLQKSLPIAVAATLLLLLVVMRSFRYALVTVVPIGLVVVWLYAIMHLAGFALNFVTATIGAVSIGVGIDYSIHMTARFREELRSASSRMEALHRALTGTGVALLVSAASSIVGFSIMGFAPMTIFSTYGILTALMIFLALVASIVVLPALLFLVTPKLNNE